LDCCGDGNGKAISILDALDVDLGSSAKKSGDIKSANPNAGNAQKDKKKSAFDQTGLKRALKTTFLES